MATIKEIAELANVSRGTVDKVIHHRSGVKKETRQRIETILSELNFQPNPLGKALANSTKTILLGIILTPAYNQFIQILLQGIQEEAKTLTPYGIKPLIKMPSSVDPAEELNILRGFHEENVSNIALFPLSDNTIINYANHLIDEGTTLFTFNSLVTKIHSAWFIGQDHYKGGRTAAQLFEKIIPSGGKIGVIISSEYITCHHDRLKGFRDRLSISGSPFRIIDILPNKDMTESAFEITMKWLRNESDLSGIYITGGGVSGVASALKFMKRTDIKLICHDLLPDSIKLLNDGIVDFVIDQDPFKQGQMVVRSFYDYITSGKVPTKLECSIPIHIRVSESL